MTRRSIGTGQVGENVRYGLAWADGVDGPASVIGKFPSLDEQSRATAASTMAYVREVGFYRHLQKTVSISTPHLHHVDDDVEANAFILIMDDLSPAVVGDQLAGCTVEQAERAIDQAVLLHTPHWGVDLSDEHPWAAGRTGDSANDFAALFSMLVPMFLECYADRLAPLTVEMTRWIETNCSAYLDSQRTPATLVHGDYRLDNMLFGSSGDAGGASTFPPPLTVVDWQTASMGRGPADAAYFVGAGLLPDVRRANEAELMSRYVSGIVAALPDGEADPDDVEFDYRIGATSGLVMAIVASQIVGRTDRGDDMFNAMAERHSAQMLDLGTTDLIG